MSEQAYENWDGCVAIVGIAAHLPDAQTPGDFWNNLKNGKESSRPFSDEELLAAGVSKAQLADARYVKRGVVLENLEYFDADFFGFSPKEAGIMDPQHRHFLEVCWEALEDSGHVPTTFDGAIGVYAGCGMGGYFMFNILSNPQLVDSVGLFLLRHTSNDKDFLSTRASYCLDLKGPSINVQTACSTSLVATHLATQALLNGECDLALAGGVTIEIPHYQGYVYHEGEVLSPDGHCRTFDSNAQGTIFGSGAGVVALRRMDDALRDNDHIYAVIRGSAVNNDGASKVGYLAPSVEGQTAAISEAIDIAGISADTIGYVECHGTGTNMGDPIELAALTEGFAQSTKSTQFCRVGSAKTNIGHLDTAAGVAGLIKAAMIVKQGEIPPTLNFQNPNPNIDFDNSPFIVNDKLTTWPASNHPRRAAINSLGVGGTNAFVVIEEPPPRASSPVHQGPITLVWSGRKESSVKNYAQKLASFLETNPDINLGDVAHTLWHGRRAFDSRASVVVNSVQDAIAALKSGEQPRGRIAMHKTVDDHRIVFTLPGGGAQHLRMARHSYDQDPVVREWMDKGFEQFKRDRQFDLKSLVFASVAAESLSSSSSQAARSEEQLDALLQDTRYQLPAIFIVEYALAKALMARGIKPAALIGHSLGENTAACLAGVLSFQDALSLVSLRGELVQSIQGGSITSVSASKDVVASMLPDNLDIATVNAPMLTTVSGPITALDAFEKTLAEKGIDFQRVKLNVPAHSQMLNPILEQFEAFLRTITLSPPVIPVISNRTAKPLTPQQAISPTYWREHLRHTVHFSDGIKYLLNEGYRTFIECGPNRILTSLVKQTAENDNVTVALIAALPHPLSSCDDALHFKGVRSQLWASGSDINVSDEWPDEHYQTIPLPTYAFARQRFWIEPGKVQSNQRNTDVLWPERQPDLSQWFWSPQWQVAPLSSTPPSLKGHVLLFADEYGFCEHLRQHCLDRGAESVTIVKTGDAFRQRSEDVYVVPPEFGYEGYSQLLKSLASQDRMPSTIIHGWLLTADERFRPGSSFFHRTQECGFYSLFFLAKALQDEVLPESLHITVLGNGVLAMQDKAPRYPEKATVLGPVKVIPRELSGVRCTYIDLDFPQMPQRSRDYSLYTNELAALAPRVAPLLGALNYQVLMVKDPLVWHQVHEPLTLANAMSDQQADEQADRESLAKCILITGGLGDLGLLMADTLARPGVTLILLSRQGVADANRWDEELAKRGNRHPVSQKILKLKQLQQKGARVYTPAVDVIDRDTLLEFKTDIEKQTGPIDGVIHAAGMVADDLIAAKTQSSIEDVFTTKVHGTLVLDAIFCQQSLVFFLSFSSTSAVIAPTGQVDYVGANCFLNQFSQNRRLTRPWQQVTAIGWGVWKEVGMAARALESDTTALAELVDQPLWDTLEPTAKGVCLYVSLSPDTHWLLDEHRTPSGQALVPGTGILEMMVEGWRAAGQRQPVDLQSVMFFQALYVPEHASVDVRLKLDRVGSGYRALLQSRTATKTGQQGWLTHAEAQLLPVGGYLAESIKWNEWLEDCQDYQVAWSDAPIIEGQAAILKFGPRWQVLRELHVGHRQALAVCQLPEAFQGEAQQFTLHPALLDIATGFAMRLIDGYDPAMLWMPVSYDSMKVFNRLPAAVWCRVELASAEDEHREGVARFNVQLCNEVGDVLIHVSALTVKRLAKIPDFSARALPASHEVELIKTLDDRKRSPAEAALWHDYTQGITKIEGQRAFQHILRYGQRHADVMVSSLSLNDLMQQLDAVSQLVTTPSDDTSFERPELDTAYVAPRDDLETALVGEWQTLLGVNQIGVHDNFFDLGGHSLIAVRLFARIKQHWHVDFPISVLFEAPTVEGCAQLIREAMVLRGDNVGVAESSTPADQVKPKRRRFTHLVAMHEREPRASTPFFLVAGMFGNVLNLRHLANLVGSDRAFYGVQAKGLYGDDQPHFTFEDMARDYIREIKLVQPEGPYMIGGFSGGGITAYEMARQLMAMGDEIALLVMLDTPLPQASPLSIADKLAVHKQRLQRKGFRYITEWVGNRYRWEVNRWRDKFGMNEQELLTETDFHNDEIEVAFRTALDAYKVKPLDVWVTHFRPRLPVAYTLSDGRLLNEDREVLLPDNGWTPYISGMDTYEVPGDHDSMVLEPNVRVLAARLKQCIKKAESNTQTPAEMAFET